MGYFDALQAICQPIRADALPNSLEHVNRLLNAISNPQQEYPCVVVAGSVGKGTTCHQIADLMDEHLKVGLYTSPHLNSFRERFRINGRMISQTEFTKGVDIIQQAAAHLDTHYSTFELATALALWWFRQQAVDIAVLEIGIGGRFDAVNAVRNELAVITPIELEHAAMLGGTLASIAHHKAGIIQPQGYAISTPQVPEVESVLSEEAGIQKAAINFEPVNTLAVAACANLMQRQIIPTYSLPAESPAVLLSGRMEKIDHQGKTFIIDGAHTASSARRLRTTIEEIASDSPVRIIVGMLRDKSAHDFLAEFDSQRFQITLTQTSSHRALNVNELQQTTELYHAQVAMQPDLQSAIQEAFHSPESLIVITGSLRMAALSREMLGLLNNEELEEARKTRAIFEGQAYLTKIR
jgi:dihydrofolate synthase/folylpolyglutamate synthase